MLNLLLSIHSSHRLTGDDAETTEMWASMDNNEGKEYMVLHLYSFHFPFDVAYTFHYSVYINAYKGKCRLANASYKRSFLANTFDHAPHFSVHDVNKLNCTDQCT